MPIGKEQHRWNYYKPYPIRYAAENNRYRQREQRKIKRSAFAVKLYLFIAYHKRLVFYEYNAAQRDEHNGQYERRGHYAHKFAVRDIKLSVKIKVLRIAERRKHAAEVGGNILHNKRKRHIFLFPRAAQHKEAQRQKREQRHVIGNEHRAYERYIHKRKYAHARRFEKVHYFARYNKKEVYVLERADHRQHAEKAA